MRFGPREVIIALWMLALCAPPAIAASVRGRMAVGATVIAPCRVETGRSTEAEAHSAEISCRPARRPVVRVVAPKTDPQPDPEGPGSPARADEGPHTDPAVLEVVF